MATEISNVYGKKILYVDCPINKDWKPDVQVKQLESYYAFYKASLDDFHCDIVIVVPKLYD